MKQFIKAKRCDKGEIYVNLKDLKETFEQDVLEIEHSEEWNIATRSMLMILEFVEYHYRESPTKNSTSFFEKKYF